VTQKTMAAAKSDAFGPRTLKGSWGKYGSDAELVDALDEEHAVEFSRRCRGARVLRILPLKGAPRLRGRAVRHRENCTCEQCILRDIVLLDSIFVSGTRTRLLSPQVRDKRAHVPSHGHLRIEWYTGFMTCRRGNVLGI